MLGKFFSSQTSLQLVHKMMKDLLAEGACIHVFAWPAGSCLVLKGNGADVAMHCVPPVAQRRMSITLRRSVTSDLGRVSLTAEWTVVDISDLLTSLVHAFLSTGLNADQCLHVQDGLRKCLTI